ncbi:FmdE family protein [Methanolobus sp. ZRKC3]|uniref:FmdE family protein n=1 Tax=Methanolobus sp. ZRKC3 TaxID=3125786 RepID=UPI003253E9C4
MCDKNSDDNSNSPSIPSFSDAASFHGHICPGLTIGYIAAKAAIEKLDSHRDVDEELVTIVENDACGVDAVQVLTGCTIGKGNLIFKDHGKQVFTFICRNSKKAVRAALKSSFDINSIDSGIGELRSKVMSGKASEAESIELKTRINNISESMRASPVEDLFDIEFTDTKIPSKARIFNSVKCTKCGEMVSESRARVHNSDFVCIPCQDEYTRGW